MHIWLGNFESEKDFEKYLDQKKYLEAWAVYDNQPPSGDIDQDAEPDPELRCDFNKEVGLDAYDEDLMIIRSYKEFNNIAKVAHDILVDKKEFEALCKKNKVKDFNVVIAYEDDNLTEQGVSASTTVKYIGKLQQASEETTSDSDVHHLWIGEDKLDKQNILKQTEIDKSNVVKLLYYYSVKKVKLDEILILQVEDYNVAERMILRVDELEILATYSMLDLVVKGNVKVDGDQIGNTLNMKYVGKFDSE